MRHLPTVARIYIIAVLVSGAVAFAWFALRATPDPALFLAVLALSSLASAFKVSLPLTTSGSTMSVSYAVDITSLLLIGTDATMLVAAVSSWAQCTFRTETKSPVYRTLFSMATLVLTVKLAGSVYAWVGGPPPGAPVTPMLPLALLGAATAYFICNTGLVAGAIAFASGQSVAIVWRDNFLWSAPNYFVGAAAAGGAAWVINRGGYWIAALAAVPLLLTLRAYKIYLGRVREQQQHVEEVSNLHLATIEALALAIDAKDQTTQSHIRRVQVYAAGLARALGMSENEVQGVKTAALLHDIGKLAVPEHILSKPGPLTRDEFQKIKIHPQVGAEIISGVPFPYPVAPLILSHHERWDGKGYPSGLQGEAIPLGARILSVVDYFDALVSERPYHKAMTLDAATELLKSESGRALDPRVVDTFIELYPSLAAEIEAHQPPRQLTRVSVGQPLAQPAAGIIEEASSSAAGVFHDIALAHREIYTLYELAQAMGSSLGVSETMALIASKLSNIVPVSCCALYLYSEGDETLTCRFATGVDADVVQEFIIRSGQGLAGWVARNRRPLVNARPAADFEAGGFQQQTTSLRSALLCPLTFNQRFIGTIAVYHTEESTYTEDHRRLLDRISEQAGAVIYNSIIFEQTQEDSLTDPLTLLPNTRFLFMHLTRELARARRLHTEIALLVLDLDNFKEINDRYGHHVGDRALREVAAVLRTTIRPYDVCVRYAGDEFIVVLSGCVTDEAERKKMELQRAVDDLPFDPVPGEHLTLSISVGIAVFPHDGNSYETLLATADGEMYRDKGRRKLQRDRSAGQQHAKHLVGSGEEKGPELGPA